MRRVDAGYGGTLTMITLSAEQPYGIKQLAAVILKNFIKKHWQARTRVHRCRS